MATSAKRKRECAATYESLVRQAREGDKHVANMLLMEFAQLSRNPDLFADAGGVPPALVRHVATCIADWRKRGYEDAATWFLVDRPAHAPDRTGPADVAAMRAYLLLKARGHGNVKARELAARYSGLTENQVRYLIEKDKPASPAWFKGRALGEIEFVVLMSVNRRLFERVRNPPRKKYQRRP